MFSWYAEGSNVCPVRVTEEGVGLKRLWLQQLRQFTSVGLETAMAVGEVYPAPLHLIKVKGGGFAFDSQFIFSNFGSLEE